MFFDALTDIKKTMKSYTYCLNITDLRNDYEEFLKINEGFIKVAKADDLKLPNDVKAVSVSAEDSLLAKVEEVIETGNFKPMIDEYSLVK